MSTSRVISERKEQHEPLHQKTDNLGFRTGPSQTVLYKHRKWLGAVNFGFRRAVNFGFRKYRNCTICIAKAKALISCAVTAQLICAFGFAYADYWFSYAVAQISLLNELERDSSHYSHTPALMCKYQSSSSTSFEPVHEKTNNLGFRPGLTQTGLYSHRTLLEAGNFVFK